MNKKRTAEYETALKKRLAHKSAILREGGEQALSHSEEDLLRIEQALNRLKTHSFGDCIDCGETIHEQRLVIYPEAERCASCQTRYEKSLN